MESILELKEIIDKLSQRERKAAKKYFSQHYKNTKELQLFEIVERSDELSAFRLKNKISRMGYECEDSKSFQKLRNRLKLKLFDYLSSAISINEIRNVDSHSFLKYRLKKMIFQANVLLEKGLFFQSNDVFRSALRLAQENEQTQEIIQSLEGLLKLEQIQGNIGRQESIEEKLQFFRSNHTSITKIEQAFNQLLYFMDVEAGNFINDKIEIINAEIEAHKNVQHLAIIKLLSDYLKINGYRKHNQFENAIGLAIKWLKVFRRKSLLFPMQYQVIVYKTFVELLFQLKKEKTALHFAFHKVIEEKSLHLRLPIIQLVNQYLIESQFFPVEKLKLDTIGLIGKDRLITIYQKAHHLFQTGKYHKCLELIDHCIRSFSIASIKQIDLMVLELMCNFELERYDLLDYRIQSFLKNLAYRSHYDMPQYYHLIYKLINVQLKKTYRSDIDLMKSLLNELNSREVNSNQRFRSFQPYLFSEWMEKKIISKKNLLEEENSEPAFDLKNVA